MSVCFLIRRYLVVPLLFCKKTIVQFGTYYLLIQLPTIYFVYSYYRVLISYVMSFLILACCGEHRLNSLGEPVVAWVYPNRSTFVPLGYLSTGVPQKDTLVSRVQTLSAGVRPPIIHEYGINYTNMSLVSTLLSLN